MKYRIGAVVAALLFCFALFPVAVMAAETADLTRVCSLTIALEDGDTPLIHVPVVVYHVAAAAYDGPQLTFILNDDFAGSPIDLDDLSTAAQNTQAAALLLAAAQARRASGTTIPTGTDGLAVFSGLTPGVYLVAPGAAVGYDAISPFLVTLPQPGPNGFAYDVTGEPKTEPQPGPASSPPPAPSQSLPPSQPVTVPPASSTPLPVTVSPVAPSPSVPPVGTLPPGTVIPPGNTTSKTGSNPNTGDESHTALWLGAFILAAGAVLALAARRKQETLR